MNRRRFKSVAWMLLLAGGALPLVGTGCQTSVGGQTLPSAYYLDDDVQYYPAGPEFLLPNKVRAIEEYQLDQQAVGGEGAQAP